jgi:hypothetical protein
LRSRSRILLTRGSTGSTPGSIMAPRCRWEEG